MEVQEWIYIHGKKKFKKYNNICYPEKMISYNGSKNKWSLELKTPLVN